MKRHYILLVLSIFLIGCTDKVEVTKLRIDERFDNYLSSYLQNFSSSINYIGYANPENYWYPYGTTPKEILDDEFRQALLGIGRLSSRLDELQPINEEAQASIDSCHLAIENQKKAINKARRAIEQANSLFGFGLFGGASTLYDFGTMFGDSDDETEVKLPANLEYHLMNVVNQLWGSYQLVLVPEIHRLEIEAINDQNLNTQQAKEIRDYLEFKIKSEINSRSGSVDTGIRNQLTTLLLDSYNQNWPVFGGSL